MNLEKYLKKEKKRKKTKMFLPIRWWFRWTPTVGVAPSNNKCRQLMMLFK